MLPKSRVFFIRDQVFARSAKYENQTLQSLKGANNAKTRAGRAQHDPARSAARSRYR